MRPSDRVPPRPLALETAVPHLTRVNTALLRSRALRALLCATSGIAFGLAAPPRTYAWLDWLALIPTLYVLRLGVASIKEAAFLGWISGLGIGMVGFAWIGETLVNFGGLPVPIALIGLLLHSTWMAVPYAFFAIAVAAGPKNGASSWLWTIVTFVALTHAWPLVFPYTPYIGLASVPAWLQLAELGGVAWVEAHVITAGWLAVRALETPALTRRIAHGTAALLLPFASYVGGDLRMQQIDRVQASAPRARVGIVQPNTPPLFGDREAAMERLWDASARAQAEGAEWIVWPEAGPYPYALARPVLSEPEAAKARILVKHRLPTLFGAVTFAPDDPLPYNTFIHLDVDGTVRATFEKVNLVPFGENIPWVDPRWLQEQFPTISHINRGAGPVRFEVELASGETLLVGPLICYEDILPEFAREVAAQPDGIEVFVNATIDAWYGASSEPWEHLALAQFRSVEHRIPMVRSVSTGVSSVIDATGRVVAWIPARPAAPDGPPPHEPEILVHDVAITRNTAASPTWFARAGWLSVGICQAATLLGAVGFIIVRRRARVAQPRDAAQHDL